VAILVAGEIETRAPARPGANPPTTPPTANRSAGRIRALRELILIAAMWGAYSLGRLVADGHVSAAFANARRVWDFERILYLPSEAAFQQVLLHSEALVRSANVYYAAVHFPATAAFLLWLYLRRPAHYLWARRALAGVTAAALVVHLIFPLAPPRMLATAGMIDTGHAYGPSVYGSPASDALANQYAAMPSLHVGWSVLVAVGLITATRTRWRWLWLAHPAITLAVVVGTANHYWLDGIVAGAIVTAVLFLLPRPTASSDRRS
jgi:hypothetical protein